MKIQPLMYTNITPQKSLHNKIIPVIKKEIPEKLVIGSALCLPFLICEIACRISRKLNSEQK